MAQFDVHRNPNLSADIRPYLLDVQSDLIGRLPTRVVVPLAPAGQFTAARHLNPIFEVEGRPVVMSTAEIAGVPLGAIGEKVGSLDAQRSEIIAAIDFLITGI